MYGRLTLSTSDVLTTRDGNVLIITINRPEARNACNLAVAEGIGDALEVAEGDGDIRAVILTGAGDKSFCAGADLKAASRGEPIIPKDPVKRKWGFAGIVAHPISKPVIAAVNGVALGGGTEISLSCDIVVACEEATFGLPEVKRGIVAAAGGVFRLPRQIPHKIAMEMMLTGDPITAARAQDLGLVNHVVPRAELMTKAMAIAHAIAANAPLAVQASKRIALGILEGKVSAEEADWQLNAHEGRTLFKTEDSREGAIAFAEKRAPVWKGK